MNSNSPSSQKAGQSGFTLLEVLVAIWLLTMISLGIFQATTSSFAIRETISTHGDFYNGIRFAMSLMERDISLMYSPVQMIPRKKDGKNPGQPPGGAEPPPEVDPAMELGGDARVESTFWTQVVDKTGIRLSNFVGLESSVSFVGASRVRIYAESPESIFSKITYELREDDRATEEMQGTYVLTKVETPNAFDMTKDEDEYTRSYPLLRGVKSMKLTYYSRDRDRWDTRWDTQSRDYRGTYPDAVRVDLEVVNGDKLSFKGFYQFKPEIPLGGIFSSM